MKLISRRSAIMALTKQMSDWNDDRNKIVEQCIGAIRGLKVHDSKERKTGKWIPVTERLPEEGLAVLVWCPQRSNIYCAYHDKRNVNKVVYSEWFIFGAFNTLVNEDVVAWMPLPEPYKEVEG